MQPVGVDGQRSVQRSRSIPSPAWSSAGSVHISEAAVEPLLEGHSALYIITLAFIATRRSVWPNKQKHWEWPSVWFRNLVPGTRDGKTDHQPVGWRQLAAFRAAQMWRRRRDLRDSERCRAAWCQTGGSEYFTNGDFQNIAATSSLYRGELGRRKKGGKNSHWVAAA